MREEQKMKKEIVKGKISNEAVRALDASKVIVIMRTDRKDALR